MRRRAAAHAAALVASVLGTGCLYTLAEIEDPPLEPFRFQLWPYPLYDSDDGFSMNVVAGFRRPANRRPPPIVEAIILDGSIAATGSRGLTVSWDRQGASRKWRLQALLGAERLRRAPYYGAGNDAPLIGSLEEREPTYYRYELLRTTAYGVVQRSLGRHVRAHVALQARHYRTRALGDSTLLGVEVASGALSDTGSANGTELRFGLLWDTRDEEATPTRGLFLEGMAARSLGGGYTRYLVSARGFVPFGEFDEWVLGGRTTVELASGPVPFYVAYERLTTWYLEDGFGGPTSLRLQPPGRYVAPNRWVTSFDVRRKLIDIPYPTAPMRVWALAFGDVGRLWNAGESVRFSAPHWSAGVGTRVQITKGTVMGLDVGASDAGPSFAINTTFAF